ncbi:maleylacetoacetate isomerase [Polynucleobacter kasalickyi]|uniref:Maleylacetoacetate isomerase/maleylpyruvate isomerase n=1 Tax=Polynucleobacter kasalickyi TaxID=1938817 RepID=A0A1W2BWQ0_9BURK|nr:maleylacetoacetate isomerase [Polynucleobacter kasalickyi]SMC77174.1 maleylacetoacetate isomerase/maleylpyruvate isomerase [Polynucleobacter kasalickyi]
MRFYGHWRSLATYRVRVAINLKGIDVEVMPIDLLGKEHLGEHYHSINPQGLLPALDVGSGPALFQSMAIIEYIDDMFPNPPLLPSDPLGKARVRALAQIIAADSHPLMVPRVRNYLTEELGLDADGVQKWIHRFVMPALETCEEILTANSTSSLYCYGDTPGLADIFLASHVIGAGFFKCDLSKLPRVLQIYENCSKLEAFAKAHPLKQPGAPTSI